MSVSSSANPLNPEYVRHYARVLRGLLRALDREVVDAALVGECQCDLLGAEREEVDRVREFLDGRVLVSFESFDLRRRGLALLDAFADEFESSEHGSPDPARDLRARRFHVLDGNGDVAADEEIDGTGLGGDADDSGSEFAVQRPRDAADCVVKVVLDLNVGGSSVVNVHGHDVSSRVGDSAAATADVVEPTLEEAPDTSSLSGGASGAPSGAAVRLSLSVGRAS